MINNPFIKKPTGKSHLCTCLSQCKSSERKWLPSSRMNLKPSKYLKAEISIGCWSYIKNEKGHYMRMTLEGYGSCTSTGILQRWCDELSIKKQKELSAQIDEVQDNFD
jgi:hypothetical protein